MDGPAWLDPALWLPPLPPQVPIEVDDEDDEQIQPPLPPLPPDEAPQQVPNDPDAPIPNMNAGQDRGPDGQRCQASHLSLLIARDIARKKAPNGDQPGTRSATVSSASYTMGQVGFVQKIHSTWTEYRSLDEVPRAILQSNGEKPWRLTPQEVPVAVLHRDILLEICDNVITQEPVVVLLSEKVGDAKDAAIVIIAWDPRWFDNDATLRELTARRLPGRWYYPPRLDRLHPAELARFALDHGDNITSLVRHHTERSAPLSKNQLRDIGTRLQREYESAPAHTTVVELKVGDLVATLELRNSLPSSPVIDVSGASYDVMAALCKNSKPLSASLACFAPLHGFKYAVFKVVTPTAIKDTTGPMVVHYEIQHLNVDGRQVKRALSRIPGASKFMLRIDPSGSMVVPSVGVKKKRLDDAFLRRWWCDGWKRFARAVVRNGDLGEPQSRDASRLTKTVSGMLPSAVIPSKDLYRLISWALWERDDSSGIDDVTKRQGHDVEKVQMQNRGRVEAKFAALGYESLLEDAPDRDQSTSQKQKRPRTAW